MNRTREKGSALILTVVLGTGLLMMSVVSVQMTLAHRTAGDSHADMFVVKYIAESAAAQALARIREGGFIAPVSGTGPTAQWVEFSGGEFYYYTDYEPSTDVSVVRAWGRVARGDNPSSSTVSPDDPSWDGTGWVVRGVEIGARGSAFIPTFPFYFGNGGLERPNGGFEWNGGTDPADPSTWGSVTSSPSSWQYGSVPFQGSALDHPANFLDNQSAVPAPPTSIPHPYQLWASQNPIGQHNAESWFANSAGSGDATSGLSPSPNSTYYHSDASSPNYPYPVDPTIPDVQDFAWSLWNSYGSDPDTTLLTQGNHYGTYGSLSNPGVTFVTGNLTVPSGTTFEGAGVLVIRDDFDPNVDTNNRPSQRAKLKVNGDLKWTGLVIVAGWAPRIETGSGGDVTIVGSLFGEDSVQSGGEISLDSATIIQKIRGPFQVLYSSALFNPGGIVYPFLPGVTKEIIGVRDLATHY